MNSIREILVLHHSHLDVGYTHSQPIALEMHREFIDAALELLTSTGDWPEGSRPKWTCEVTEPLLHWMRTAGEEELGRLRAFVAEGRIGISAMQYNTTPLCDAELLARQLAPLSSLRRILNAPIRTLNQHDVNGIPWPFADAMIDAGIELFIMAVNLDHGHAVRPRPGVFLWSAPSGRRLLVMNGNHYSMFDQMLRTWDNSLASMREGLDEYLVHLAQSGYPLDFLYLTSTNPPEAWDNAPPNPWVARLIRQWNEEGHDPPIRYVTPEDLLARIRRIDPATLPVLRGDWTDYWSFGFGSAAYEIALSRKARFSLNRAELLAAGRGQPPTRALRGLSRRAWESLALCAEHTWTYWDPGRANAPTRAQSALKASYAHTARELAEYLYIDQLEALAGNPAQSVSPNRILIVNPTQRARTVHVRVPDSWMKQGKNLRSVRFTWQQQEEARDEGTAYGPFLLPPFGWQTVPFAALRPAPAAGIGSLVRGPTCVIYSPFHEMSCDLSSGQVTGLTDKATQWQVLPVAAEHGFFDYVWERPDPQVNGSRRAYYDRDMSRELLNLHCWKTDWKAERRGPSKLVSCDIRRTADSVSLDRVLEAPGVRRVRQVITLRSDSPVIGLSASLDTDDREDPNAIYFAFPLNFDEGWTCAFDTAGIPVALDTEQLPGSCRGWFSVDTVAALGTPGRTAALICPDATLVQAGSFNFGRLLEAVPRNADPLLLAWPMNNYWNTNFPFSQPGVTTLRYGFLTAGALDAAAFMTAAMEFIHPPIAHPAFDGSGQGEGRLLHLEGQGVMLNHVKPAADGRGIILRLVNVGEKDCTARIRPGWGPAESAWRCGTLEDDRDEVPVKDGRAEVRLSPRRLTVVRIR